VLVAGVTMHHGMLDQTLQRRVNAWGSAGQTWWSMLSVLGLGPALLVLLAAVSVQHPRRLAAGLLLLLLGGLLVQALKYGLRLPRPAGYLPADTLTLIGEALHGRSMPSGHAASAFAMVALAAWEPGVAAAWRWRRAALLLVPAVGMALARVAVGAHWPSDVVVGAALGLALGRASWWAVQHADWPLKLATPAARRAVAALLLLFSLGFALQPLGYPAGQPMRWLLVATAVWAARRWWASATPLVWPKQVAL
jgi:membrane-associated phospholipid phosphatase